MTLNIYLLLFMTLSICLMLYAYFSNGAKDVNGYTLEIDNCTTEDLKTTIDAQSTFCAQNQNVSYLEHKKTIERKQEMAVEIQAKIKKYNKQLNRSLKTLTYVSVMETSPKTTTENLQSVFNLKRSLQFEVVRITAKINDLKAQLEA